MIYYLNLGFVLEQALVDVTKTYIERLHLDSVYNNFHISVVNEHPFAHMMIEDKPTGKSHGQRSLVGCSP